MTDCDLCFLIGLSNKWFVCDLRGSIMNLGAEVEVEVGRGGVICSFISVRVSVEKSIYVVMMCNSFEEDRERGLEAKGEKVHRVTVNKFEKWGLGSWFVLH